MYDRLYGSNRFRRFFSTLIGRHPERNEFWALRDVSFDLEEGKSLGIIGPNGSGKTTILRILSGISHIDRGRVRADGTVSALIALGAGFHPELSGRENIYLNGAILGLKRSEIRKYLDSIVDFAGIGDYIDAPVKRYSSGMFVRLGFAVAAQVRPDILLVDEVLAVGDARFQMRCHERIRQLREQGTVIILVSHDLWAIRQSCQEGIFLYKGEVLERGPISKVIAAYDEMDQLAALKRISEKQTNPGREEEALRSCDLEFIDTNGAPVTEIGLGEPLTLRLHFRLAEPVKRPTLVLEASAHNGPSAMVLRSRKAGWFVDFLEGDGSVDISIPEMRLNPGRYAFQGTIKDEADLTLFAASRHRELFVRPPSPDWCLENCYYVPEAAWGAPRSKE